MSRQKVAFLVSALVLLILSGLSVTAQGPTPANCPQIVQTALQSVENACQGMGRNETCYGHNRVDAVFWQARDDLVFSAPADRVPLIDVRQIATARMDLDAGQWGVAALQLHGPDLPRTLPGQAVMFLLMGESLLENDVSPDTAALPVEPVTALTTSMVNLYTTPTTLSNTLGAVPEGTRVQLVGQDESGAWFEVLLGSGGRAWINGEVTAFAARGGETLPVTYGDNTPPRYGPMQAFYFTTSLGGPVCNEAPDALVIQNPDNLEVTFNVNNLTLSIGSTIGLTTAAIPDGGGQRALVVVLYEGHLQTEVNGTPVYLNQPGQAIAVSLNGEGRVDGTSSLQRMLRNPVTQWLHSACTDSLRSRLFTRLTYEVACRTDMQYYTGSGFVPAFVPYIPPPPPPVVVQPPVVTTVPPGDDTTPPFAWPQIIRPASGTYLVGQGTHEVIWTDTGAASYRLDVLPDGTNTTQYSASYTAQGTSYPLPIGQMPSRPHPGWGYFLRVIPLDASGAPLGPPGEAPLVWVVRQDPDATEEVTVPPRITDTPTPTLTPTYDQRQD